MTPSGRKTDCPGAKRASSEGLVSWSKRKATPSKTAVIATVTTAKRVRAGCCILSRLQLVERVRFDLSVLYHTSGSLATARAGNLATARVAATLWWVQIWTDGFEATVDPSSR